jgi:uncharacterized protein YndB with AHSA1/START domain
MTRADFIAEPGKQEAITTRVFDAPREFVFKVVTDPNLISQWWGPKRFTTTVDKMEIRQGGVWRFVQRGPDGNAYAFSGVYHAIVPPERLVYTFEFEGMPGHVTLEIVTLEEHDGKTKFTDKIVFQTVEDRDGMIKWEMKEGKVETMNRLAELLKKLLKE